MNAEKADKDGLKQRKICFGLNQKGLFCFSQRPLRTQVSVRERAVNCFKSDFSALISVP
jgi:hypothetical protein